ncbi:MAG: tyrosine-type recombinase/integrase [Crocinitomicaceae bacterium]|nr:tyrosine-type recombinase/integrase [Crocinitomicaceae bacterium]MBK8926287.1 tyrosine-type recombinase/integrase [Crocinitomicaceae bacterium]
MQLPEDFIHYLIHEKRYSEHTVIAYKKDIENFLEILAISSDDEIKDLKHRHLRSYLVELVEQGLENTSVNRKLSSVKTFFKFLRQTDNCAVNPATKVKSLKQKKSLPNFVPESQVWNVNTVSDEDDEYATCLVKLILETFYQTGIRLSELINLKESDISKSQIKVLGKRNKERIIPISSALTKLIEEFRQQKDLLNSNGDYLFCDKSGKKLSPKFVYRKVNYYLGKATDLSKKSPHVLRHTFATHMLNNGASLESIKKLLGHADLSATQIYTHNSFAQIKKIYNKAHPRGGAD